MKIRFNSENMFRWAFYLLIILICLPLGTLIPGIIRMPLQILSAIFFVAGLILLRKPTYLLSLLLLFLLSCLYFEGAWNEAMSASSFLFNSLSCWEIVVYSLLCINKIIKPDQKIFWLITVITCVTAATTLIGLQKYPLAVRELGRTISYTGEDIRVLKALYRSLNIAGWSQVFGMVFFQGSLIYSYKKNRNKFILITIIINEICILNSQLAFAILFSIMILVLICTNIKSRNYYFGVCIVAVICIVAILEMEPILTWALEISKEEQHYMLTAKLQDLYNFLVLHTATGDAKARFDVYALSLNGIKQFPFGLFMHPEVQAVHYIGFHSDFFDIIGTFGVFGIILLISGVTFWAFKIHKFKDPYDNRFICYLFISFLFMAIVNPVFYSPQIWLGAFLLPVTVLITESTSLSSRNSTTEKYNRPCPTNKFAIRCVKLTWRKKN